jgi:hypothetical protein
MVESSVESRANAMFCVKRRQRTSARKFSPKGEPFGMSAGGAALNFFQQFGQLPPCSAMRVT